MTAIDWARMGRPQPDGYDTDMALRLVETEPAPWRPHKFHRPAPDGAPSIAGGTVALSALDPLLPAPRWQPVDGVPAILEHAIALVGRWPEVARHWPRIIHTIQCFTDVEAPAPRLYSASHSVGSRFGVIGLTVLCPLATAQALVHEMAHAKLRAMGVDNEHAIRIVANPPDEVFPSPVVGRARPITAVLHAQYSFIHVTQLDLCMLRHETDAATRSDIRALLARNVPRMTDGLAVLRDNLRPSDDGKAFVGTFLDWCDTVLTEGRHVLASPAL